MARRSATPDDFTGLVAAGGKIGFVQQAATIKVGEKGTVARGGAAVRVITATAGRAGHTGVDFKPPGPADRDGHQDR